MRNFLSPDEIFFILVVTFVSLILIVGSLVTWRQDGKQEGYRGLKESDRPIGQNEG